MSIEAMKQALDALRLSDPEPRLGDDDYVEQGWKEHNAAIVALRAAIAEASMQRLTEVQQEMEQCPFGYFKAEPFGWTDCAETDEGARPLYEHPPHREWVGLTMDELATLVVKTVGYPIKLAESIEAKLKEKHMTPEDITKLAGHRTVPPWVMKLVQDAIAAEREACAEVCADKARTVTNEANAKTAINHCVAAIRARGEK